jgi:hypothetical protein
MPPNIVPGGDAQQSIGTSFKKWLQGYFYHLTVQTLDFLDGAGAYLRAPQLTSTERVALTPNDGMIVYDTTLGQLMQYSAGQWVGFGGGGSGDVTGPSSSVTGHMATYGNTTGKNIVDGGAVPVVPAIDTTATDITMNGVQSAGSIGKTADAGHVHPIDTSRQATLTDPVTGPGSGVTVGHLAVMNNTSGTVIADGGAVPVVPAFDSTAIDIKMNGTQSAGSSGLIPNSDHVHPIDTSRQGVLTNPVTASAPTIVSGDVVTGTGTGVQVQDSGTLLSALATKTQIPSAVSGDVITGTGSGIQDSGVLLSSLAAKSQIPSVVSGDVVTGTGTGIQDSGTLLANLVLTSDSRLSNARAPTAHASTHLPSGTDPLSLYPITTTIYIDGNRVDTYTADGSISKPFKTIGAAVTAATGSVGYCFFIAPGTYSESGSISFPNVPIVIYGNDSAVTWTGGVTVQNSNFARYDLNSIGTVTYAGTGAGRVVIQGGSLVGNVTINTPVTDLKSCTLSGGIVTINSGAICLAIACTFTSRIVEAGGTLFVEDCAIDRTDNTNFLITSTSGQLVVANSVLNNHGSAGCISCNNGATTLPNAISNNFITVASGAPVACGAAVTLYSKNVINGTNTGTGYIPITSDIIGPSGIALGSDATGDIYYRNSSGVLTRLPIGTSGYVLQSSGTIPQWVSGGGSGTVTSVASGNGMNFATITGTGTVTMGTPGSTTSSSTNATSVTSHTHAIDTTIFTAANGKTVTTPIIDGTATIGNTNTWADGGHIHPNDTSRAPTASPTFTGTVTIPSANDSLVLSGTPPANGVLLIGDGTGFRPATLTQGSNVTISNGAGTITIAASGGGGGASFWTALTATTDFATTAPSTSTITMNTDQTANIKAGYGLTMVFNGNTYRAVVTAITSSLLTFAGPPITTGAGLLTALSWGDESRVKAIPVLMPGYYEAATVATYINSNLLSPSGYEWEGPTAYCCGFKFQTSTADGSSNGYVQLVVNGNNISSVGASGILVNATTLLTTGVSVNTFSNINATIAPGQYFEISVTKGTGGDATNGRLTALFVVP